MFNNIDQFLNRPADFEQQNESAHAKSSHMDSEWINLSFYRFCDLEDEASLKDLRVVLKALSSDLQMKGTILIAPEGINAMVSGLRPAIEAFKSFCVENLKVEKKDFKEAQESTPSFTRMLVKIKKEIITVGEPSVRPEVKTATRLSPKELKQWLDQKKPIVLLDTRNRYEIETGTFQNSQSLDLNTSREFKKKAIEHLDELKIQSQRYPIVTFCTGGIRCEKASAVLLELGMENVYQLDGGILRYFEENGAEYFDGNCFVFDWRLAVDGSLRPTTRSTDSSREDFGRHR